MTPDKKESILFFCPSLGEYQAIKPIIDLHKDQLPHLLIEVTFFSPSGFLSLPQMDHKADHISYSPYDLSGANRDFFTSRDIKHVVISTFALWPGFLTEMTDRHIPFTFVNAKIKHEARRKLYYQSLSHLYKNARTIYCSDQMSHEFLSSLAPSAKVHLGGDPRIKMILDHYDKIGESVNQKSNQIIFASIEASEENHIIEKLADLISSDLEISIVPHDVERASYISKEIHRLYPQAAQQIKVISQMGLLLDLFPQHTLAYVGGGFDEGIHNIAEPLLANCRVIIGPKHEGDSYASRCIEEGAVKVVHHPSHIVSKIKEMSSQGILQSVFKPNLGWIKSYGNQVQVMFEDMKSLY